MTKDIEKLEQKCAELAKEIEAFKQKQRDPLAEPEDGTNIFVAWTDGKVKKGSYISALWHDEWLNGIVFYSHKEAEDYVKRRMLETKLRRLANFKPDWSDMKQAKHHVCWDHEDKKPRPSSVYYLQNANTIYFKSPEDRNRIYAENEADFKFLLGVE